MEYVRKYFVKSFARAFSLFSLRLFILLPASVVFGRESREFVDKVVREHGLNAEQRARFERLIFSSLATRNIGTEDPNEIFGPNNSVHPASRQTCQDRVLKTGLIQANPQHERHCGAKWMAPIGPDQRVCIDQFEFPNIPCEYPLVWVSSSEANQICQSMGKRLCNSHEWEGSCAGRKHNAAESYRFELPSLHQRRTVVNQSRERVWAFQWSPPLVSASSRNVCGIFKANDPDFDPRIQGRVGQFFDGIGKSRTCHTMGSDYRSCGTNTWPAGMKHQCRTEAGVYDLHGNVAELVNFPRTPQGLARGTVTDYTERKGSFFVVRPSYEDDCRVRQPYEHFHQITTDRHSYYQEGFRCCKDL